MSKQPRIDTSDIIYMVSEELLQMFRQLDAVVSKSYLISEMMGRVSDDHPDKGPVRFAWSAAISAIENAKHALADNRRDVELALARALDDEIKEKCS